MVRRELNVGTGEEDSDAMILLRERIVYEIQSRWIFAEDVLAKHVRGDSIPYHEWKKYIEYVRGMGERAVYVSPCVLCGRSRHSSKRWRRCGRFR